MFNLEEIQAIFAAFKSCYGWVSWTYEGLVREKYCFNIYITGRDLTTVTQTIDAFALMMVGEDLSVPEFQFEFSELAPASD